MQNRSKVPSVDCKMGYSNICSFYTWENHQLEEGACSAKKACAVKMKIINGGQVQGWYGRGADGPDFHFQDRSPHSQDSGARGGLQQNPGLALMGLYRHPVGTGCRCFLLGRVCKGTEKCPVVSGLGSPGSWAG